MFDIEKIMSRSRFDGEFEISAAKAEVQHVLRCQPRNRVEFLREQLVLGHVNGTIYCSEGCGCFYGTLGIAAFQEEHDAEPDCEDDDDHREIMEHVIEIASACNVNTLEMTDEWSVAEQFTWSIRTGDTPENNVYVATMLEWIDEVLAS